MVKKVFHFMGKGGVGKTTSAATQASLLSERGKTLIVSLDPAHNLGDVLGAKVGEEPEEVAPNLYAAEPNVDRIISSFVKRVVEELQDHYKYLKVYNLDNVLRVLEYTPGVEEQALLEALAKFMNLEVFDYLVIDHAPTGLSVRVLLLPEIMEGWLERLIELRKQIIKRRKILGDDEEDQVLNILLEELEKNKKLKELLKDPERSSVIVVLNPEEMPFLEAKRIKDTLADFGIPLCGVVVNKIVSERHEDSIVRSIMEEQKRWLSRINEEFKDYKIIRVPYLVPPPKGLETLKKVGREVWGGALCCS
ncbi:ArsA family ATPase [Ignicoccus hospitalis]|uniref:ArsA family ATPase n=1 Tax=Ignicoccus hospitalis TaxID=160233 RepID=UPI000AC6AC39|nr:ArsA family ATPase [Ignicoccus hospitalis]